MAIEALDPDRILGISSMAMRDVLNELGNAYAQRVGPPVETVSVGGVDALRRVQEGVAFDFVVLAADAIERLAMAGRIESGTRVDLARSAIAMAVPAGAARPDVTNEAAVRTAVLRARTIGYSTGPSGAHLVRLFDRWGITEAIARRVVQAAPGVPVGTLVARGEVELGFQQSSELMHVAGIDVLGPLPAEIQALTTFSAAVCTASRCRAEAKALLDFLASPEADAAKRRHGMEPARAGA
jgi:molybdate transport system substrate-binding protein